MPSRKSTRNEDPASVRSPLMNIMTAEELAQERESEEWISRILKTYKTLIGKELRGLGLPTDSDSLGSDHIRPKLRALPGQPEPIDWEPANLYNVVRVERLERLTRMKKRRPLKLSTYLLWEALRFIPECEKYLSRGRFYQAMEVLHFVTFFATKAGIEIRDSYPRSKGGPLGAEKRKRNNAEFDAKFRPMYQERIDQFRKMIERGEITYTKVCGVVADEFRHHYKDNRHNLKRVLSLTEDPVKGSNNSKRKPR